MIEKTIYFIKMISGEWIVASIASMNEMGITFCFPMNRDCYSMWLKETDIQIYNITHQDYILVKEANKDTVEKWKRYIELYYKDDLIRYESEFQKILLSNLTEENRVLH